MNLGKLLGAGKSFFGGRSAVSYRKDKRVYLPKFNADKNPFVPKPPKPAPDVVVSKHKPSNAPAAVIGGASARKAVNFSSPPTVRPVRAIGWKDKLNPFRTPEPVAPPMVGAVQAELSLDAVKVVHNDLADADIEIVPVKSRTVTAEEAPNLPPARRPWEFLGERLINAG